MLKNKIQKIGIVAPVAYRHVLGLTNLRSSFAGSFPEADIVNLEESDLQSLLRLHTCDLIILPSSFYGEDTPYKHYLKGRAAKNIAQYAQDGALATFCSGTYAILDNFSYIFSNGSKERYAGYVPLIDLEASGPIDFDAVSSRGVTEARLRLLPVFTNASLQGTAINLCYDGGPAIEYDASEPRSDMRPLAYFENGLVSILAHKTANGIIVAFGSLAEIQAADVPDNEVYGEIRQGLYETQEPHNALWNEAMEILESGVLYPSPKSIPPSIELPTHSAI